MEIGAEVDTNDSVDSSAMERHSLSRESGKKACLFNQAKERLKEDASLLC